MKKIKDFFYDKNDIIIVLLIVAAAAFIIYTRIGAIMDYPETLAKEAAETATEAQMTTAVVQETEPSATEPAPSDTSADGNTDSTAAVSITITDSDSSVTVSEKLQNAGLVSSATDFTSYVNEQGKSGSLKSGTFQIPSGSSEEEILNIITQ